MVYLGEIAALAAAVLWSGTSIAFTEASVRVGSMVVNVTRLIFATLFLALTILAFGVDLSVSAEQIFYLVLSGFAGLVFGDTFLFKSFEHIGARLSMLFMSLAPPIAALLAFIFLGEEISIWGAVGIVVTIAGIAIVVLQREEVPSSEYKISRIGILYAVLGAVGQGVGLIFAKLAFNVADLNGFVAAEIRIVTAAIILIPLVIFSGRFQNLFKVYRNNLPALKFTIVGAILGPFLGITFSLIAVANTFVGIAATLMATVPIIMLPIVRVYYKEKLTWKSIAGACMAGLGIAILFLK